MIRFGTLLLFVAISFASAAQITTINLSGIVRDRASGAAMPYVNALLKSAKDSSFVTGTASDENGHFKITHVNPGEYIFELSYAGYVPYAQRLQVGKLSEYLDLGAFSLQESTTTLREVVVDGTDDIVDESLQKKTFKVAEMVSQSGGSLLQVMQNLPGVTVQEGVVKIRGSDKVAILIDGKQTALTGFGTQASLDNIPASAIERIEVINNPSAKYDANGNAGIINIIYKKETKEGFNGKVGMAAGLGALWIKQENLPTIDPQYQNTPKLNPTVSLNYRKKKINLFLQLDDLYTKTLNKNEFVDRYYETGDTVRQQTRRNRTTNFLTGKTGVDWYINDRNTVTISGLLGTEKIIDHGQEPFFNGSLSERLRLWQFLEDEIKTTGMVSATWQHRYEQPGRSLTAGINYSFHREDEKYFFTNIMPTYVSEDSFKLLSDEHVTDLNLDYVRPLKYGRFETGLKFRNRYIPTNMDFYPGTHTALDTTAGGWANYREVIPAVYGNYVFENQNFEVEAGLRVEYVKIDYDVNPEHNTYESDGYHYTQPFPTLRFAYKIKDTNVLSLFYNRRVDRPNEVDIRIFPKYDDAEIIKVGNPGLRPQFTNSVEFGYKKTWPTGSLYGAFYQKEVEDIITRIASIQPGDNLIYNIYQNAGESHISGIEIIFSHTFQDWATLNINLNGYRNTVGAFTVVNKYPSENIFSAPAQTIRSGSIKVNGLFHLKGKVDLQVSTVYQAPDVVPQGKTYSRFYLDVGLKKSIQKGKGEIFVNATDAANTLRIKKHVEGDGFRYESIDYYETQVFRIGYSLKF